MQMHMKSQRQGLASRRRSSQQPASHRRAVVSRAEAKSGLAKWSDSIGMPTDDGFFGFTPFAEMWVGRWAQIGFVSSIIGEATTGHGTLQQIGLPSPSAELLVALSVLLGGATIAGTVRTVQRATAKQMSLPEINRYKAFLGLTKEDDYKEAAKAMKRAGDFTTPGNNEAALAAAKASGAPVDAFLSTNEVSEASRASQEMKAGTASTSEPAPAAATPSSPPSSAAAQKQKQAEMGQYAEKMYFGASGELEFARSIEMTNGRWAMIGFLAAVMVEAATGEGILGQLITICKWSGLLGERSGF